MYIDITPNDDRWYDLKDLPNEHWKDIKNYEGLYQVSDYGRVKRLERIIKSYILYHEYNVLHPKILKPSFVHGKYYKVVLTKENKKHNKQVHRLVAEAFIPNPNNLPCVNHKDPVEKGFCNNIVSNLQWSTLSENTQYMIKLHRNKNGSEHRVYSKGKDHHNSKVILKIDEYGDIIEKYDCVRDFIESIGFSPSKCNKILKNKEKINNHYYVYDSMKRGDEHAGNNI